jgi:hypothetical protein
MRGINGQIYIKESIHAWVSFVLGELKNGQDNHLHFVQLRFTQFGFVRCSRGLLLHSLSPGYIDRANVSTTEWLCQAELLCRVFGTHYQSILNLGMRISRPRFAFGFFVEPLLVLVSEFQDRTTRLFMRKVIVDESWDENI